MSCSWFSSFEMAVTRRVLEIQVNEWYDCVCTTLRILMVVFFFVLAGIWLVWIDPLHVPCARDMACVVVIT